MKKEYMKPLAEKVVFDYSNSVTASVSYETTDYSVPEWECHIRFADAQYVCGYDGHDLSNPQWKCELK